MTSISSLENPLTDEQVDAANADPADLWIHIKCNKCGDVEPCFNRSYTAWKRICLPCQMAEE